MFFAEKYCKNSAKVFFATLQNHCCAFQCMMMTFLYKNLRANLIFPDQEAFTKCCRFHSLQVESRKTILDSVFHVSIHFHQRGMQRPRPEHKTVIRQPLPEYVTEVTNSYKKLEIMWIPHYGAGKEGMQLWRTLTTILSAIPSTDSSGWNTCVQNTFWKLI